jgi:hypothetical protein
MWFPRSYRHRSQLWPRILGPRETQVSVFSLGGIGAPCCCTEGPPVLVCNPCDIPEENLTLSYVNPISGNGTAALIYSSSPTGWTSACAGAGDSLIWKLLCTGGQIELRAIYFTAGSCPTGTEQYCSNLRSNPLKLTLASYTCSPFSITFTLTSASCPVLLSSGYTSFTVTA